MFFVVIKIEILTGGIFSSIAIELKHDGQCALSDQELDRPSCREEMKQHHLYIYAVLKCIVLQLPEINSPHCNGLKNYIYILNMCIMLLHHNHENVSYANLVCINVLKILIKRITENKINI